jgi:hypothetical protein
LKNRIFPLDKFEQKFYYMNVGNDRISNNIFTIALTLTPKLILFSTSPARWVPSELGSAVKWTA